MNIDEYVRGVVSGDRRAIARAITLIESDSSAARAVLAQLPKRDRKALIIGVTGAPGAGKSTLLGRLALDFAERGLDVGILAIDPTSPFTGGAVLGDRLRMIDAALVDKIFIRSMASRGGLGGLSEAAEGAAKLLEASGKDVIMIETVGAGQSDVEVARIADVVMLVVMPQTGDEIQSLKAGILEIADIVVVNKSDIPGAETTINILRNTLPNNIKILKTSALTGEGVRELAEKLLELQEKQDSTSQRRRKRIEDALAFAVIKHLTPQITELIDSNKEMRKYVDMILEREITIEAAAHEIAQRLRHGLKV